MKKMTANGAIALHQRYIYRGYLQVAACDLTRGGHPCLWLITWDPTQPMATRPLAIQKDGTWYCYGWDLTKNVCEVFGQAGYIRETYAYTPYGSVTEEGDVTQPLQWSSEYADPELGLVYYNYRYYNPTDGRWIRRDILKTTFDQRLYLFSENRPIHQWDYVGLTVRIRYAVPNILGGELASFVGKYHKWIKTDHYEMGMGNENGVPGENGQTSPDMPFSPTYVVDHSGRTYIGEIEYPDVDEECVNSYLIMYSYLGLWTPLVNDCNSYVDRIIHLCTPKCRPVFSEPTVRLCVFGGCGGNMTFPSQKWGVIYAGNLFVEIKQ